MSERTRKKTNANEIADDEWIVVRTKQAELRDRLTHVHGKGVAKCEIEEMLEDYVRQCEKAMQTGKRDDLPKYFQTRLNEQKRERENEALMKTASPPKTAESVSTLVTSSACASSTTTTVVKVGVQVKEGKAIASKEKKKGEKK